MKIPGRDTWTIWYSLIALGILTSIVLARFAGIRFLHSIWFTVPVFFASGNLLFNWWMKSIDKRNEKETTPIATRVIPEVGIVRQLPEHWETNLEIDGENIISVPVSFEAGSSGPSDRQIELARELSSKYSEKRQQYLSHLKDYFAGCGAAEAFQYVLLDNISVHIFPDDETEDMEICFETQGESSDMAYYIVLKDWNVLSVYGAD